MKGFNIIPNRWRSFALAIVAAGMVGATTAQVNYSVNFFFNDGGWTGMTREINGTTCTGGGMYVNLYNTNTTNNFVSPLVGTAIGGAVTINYDYKAANWAASEPPSNTVPATFWGQFNVQYAASAGGPWTTIANINNETQTYSCLPKSHTFTPPPGPLYIRYSSTWQSGDFMLNFGNVVLTEAAALPCAGTPAPGNTTGPAGVVSGGTVALGLQNSTPGSGVSYQWYVSTTSAVAGFSPVGPDNFSYSPTQTAQSWYYATVTCGANTGTSNVLQVDLLNVTLVPSSGVDFVDCGTNTILRDDGDNADYSDNADGFIVLDAVGTSVVNINGTYSTEATYDYLYIYYGAGTGGSQVAGSPFDGAGTINVTGIAGQPLTVRFYSDGGTVDTGFDLNVTYSGSCVVACTAPSAPSATAITSTGATVNWTCAGCTGPYVLDYGVAPYNTPGTGATAGVGGNVITSATTTASLAGLLSPATAYDVYVRQVCAGPIYSANTVKVTFTTPCGTVSLPFREGFNSTSTSEACWTTLNLSGSYGWDLNYYNGTAYTYEGDQVASMRTNSNDNDWLISPPINLTGAAELRYFYLVQSASYTPDFEVLLSTTGNSPGDFTNIVVPLASYNNTTWAEKIANLTAYAGQTVYIAWHLPSGNSTSSQSRLFLDYVNVLACPSPSALAATNVTTSGADLNWTENGIATTWDLEIGITGFPPTGTPTINNVGSKPYTWTGGAASTVYQYYVRADCSGDNLTASAWTGPFSFTTACGVFSAPFVEGFNSTSTSETCWTVLNVNADADAWNMNYATNPYFGNQSASLLTNGNAGNNDDWLISPAINLTGAEWLRYYYRVQLATEPDQFEVRLSTTGKNPADFTEVLVPFAAYSNIAYQEQRVFLTGYTGTVYIAFHVPSGGLDGNRLYIDEVTVETAPTCLQPTNLGATNLTTVGADLSWTEVASETVWDLAIGPVGFTPTNTPTVNDVGSNPYTWAGGAPTTTYQYYVRVDCGSDNVDVSFWSGPFTFTTACGVYSAPFRETFNSVAPLASSTEVCWTVLNVTGAGTWNLNSTGAFEGNQTAFINTNGNNGVNDDWLISPPITLTGAEQLRYFYRMVNTSPVNNFEVLLSTTGTNPADFTNVLVANTAYTNSYDAQQIAFLNQYSGTVYIAFHVPSNGVNGRGIYIDDVNVEAGPTCPDPSTLGAINQTSVGADLRWTDNAGATAWDLEIGTLGFTPTGTPTNNDVGTNPYTWTGGSGATAYQFYVRADCGMDNVDVSAWIGPFTFNTGCPTAFSVPFQEGFNSTSASEACWTVRNVNGDADQWNMNQGSGSYTYEGDQSAQFNTDYNAGNNDDWLISPPITLTGAEQLRYYYRVRSAGEPNDFEVLLSTTGTLPADFTNTVVPFTSYSNTTYAVKVVNLAAYSGTVYLAWHVPPGGLDGWYIYLDNVNVEAGPGCPNVTGLTANNYSLSNVNVSWTAAPIATNYRWEIQQAPNAQGTPGAVASGTGAGTSVAAAGTYVDGGQYILYVASECAAVGTYQSLPFTVLIPPPNDNCANAIGVSCNTTTSGSTVNSNTTGVPATCSSLSLNTAGGIWYTVSGWNGPMTVDLSGSNFNTKVAVFTGTCGSLVCVDSDDDDGAGTTSLLTWAGSSAQTYYIYVTGASTETGLVTMTVTCGDNNPACAENGLNLEFQNDANPGQVTWEVLNQSGSVVVLSGADPIPANSVGTQALCLPDGCYRLRVLDSAGDGMTTGGYQLRETGTNGRRIIDNTNNFSTGSVSAISGGGTFCLPIGDVDLIFSSCDKLDWVNYKYMVCHADAAVAAEWVPSGANSVQDANSGYEFWIFDPNGTYSFRKFHPHNQSQGYSPASANRACRFKINDGYNTTLNPWIPQGVKMNVRVRGRVNGVNQSFGPACTMMLDAAAAACPLTSLQDDPSNVNDFSCGVSRTFGGTNTGANKIVANPPQFVPAVVSNQVRYQFRFRIPAEGICIVRPIQTSPTLYLNWTAASGPQLVASKTYEVEVRASKDQGATWCAGGVTPACDPTPATWGKACNVTISGVVAVQGGSSNMSMTGEGALTMFPNPNNGDQLTISLTEVASDVHTMSVDIYDLTGKRITARTIAVQDGFVTTVLDLNNEISNGLYMVNITAGEKTYTQRLVIQK